MKRATHCRVLEFVADEGIIYVPYSVGRNEERDPLWATGVCG